MDFLIDFIILPILCFVIVVLLLLFFASVYVYCTDEKYRKSMDADLESNKKYGKRWYHIDTTPGPYSLSARRDRARKSRGY